MKQIIEDKPYKRVKIKDRTYRYIKKCNSMLYLYQDEEAGWFTTFSSYDLGLIGEPDEKPGYTPHWNKL